MARVAGTKAYNTFVAGLVTDASEVNFPENASVDETNFKLLIDGSRKKRRGAQVGATTKQVPGSPEGVSRGEWRSAGGDASVSFEVVKYREGIYLYKQEGDDLGASEPYWTISLALYKAPNATNVQVSESPVQFSYGKGYLFIVGKYIEPLYVAYDKSDGSISVHEVDIHERDIHGVDDGLDPGVRPSSLSSEHLYNLLNQGWTTGRINSYRSSSGVYPSNAQIWFTGKHVNVDSGKDTWAADQVDLVDFGNTPAPKGRFVRSVFDTNQSFSINMSRNIVSSEYGLFLGTYHLTLFFDAAHQLRQGDTFRITEPITFTYDTGIPAAPEQDGDLPAGTYTVAFVVSSTAIRIARTLPNYDSNYQHTGNGKAEITVSNPAGYTLDTRPQATAFFASRVWYAGIEEQQAASNIYFSQIIRDERDFGRCYQEADPTAEQINELVATDGGVIRIPEMGQVRRLVPTADSLVVFAENGVWIISGNSGYFTADSFSVRNVLRDSFSSPESVVVADGMPIFLTETGIFVLQQDKVTGYLSAQNISQGVIQRYLNDIPGPCLEKASGSYNPLSKTVVWTFSRDTSRPESHSEVLHLDLRLQAFYRYTIDTSDPDMPAILGPGTCIETTDEDKKLQYFFACNQSGEWRVGWSTFSNENLVDWEGVAATDYTAYLDTGYEIMGDLLNKKQATYVRTYFRRTEQNWVEGEEGIELDNPSSCTLQGRWHWANSGDFGRWSSKQEAYRLLRPYMPDGEPGPFNYGTDVISTKLKVRGKGTALSLHYESPPGKDCHILGWAVPFTSTTTA